jgi:hypothetical protein
MFVLPATHAIRKVLLWLGPTPIADFRRSLLLFQHLVPVQHDGDSISAT